MTNNEATRHESIVSLDAPPLSDDAIALLFSAQFNGLFRYRPDKKRWKVWSGTYWRNDEYGAVIQTIRLICRGVAAGTGEKAVRTASLHKIESVEKLARSDPKFMTNPVDWDKNEDLLATIAGEIDLRTGFITASSSDHFITKCTSIKPGGVCPTWMAFLQYVTGGNSEYQTFLQRLAGYCLTGHTREQKLFFIVGPGANGKSIFTRILSEILGPHAVTAGMDTMMTSTQTRHPTELMALKEARLVVASETEVGGHWAEAKIKILTGGEDIAARFMHRDLEYFTPRFKLLFTGNSLPNLKDCGEAMRRRIVVIPFLKIVPEAERNTQLFENLRAELGGILGWAIEGSVAWHRDGLPLPPCVAEYTKNYLFKKDQIGRFLSDMCDTGPELKVSSTLIHPIYEQWCRNHDVRPLSQHGFVQELIGRGYTKDRTAHQRLIQGLNLKNRGSANSKMKTPFFRHMSTVHRLEVICGILALGLMRREAAKSSLLPNIAEQISLDLEPWQSGGYSTKTGEICE